MQNIRRQHSSKFKAQVALEALLENKTIAEIASFYKIHPTQIHKWKKCLKANMSEIFLDKRTKEKQDKEDLIEEFSFSVGSYHPRSGSMTRIIRKT